jgi:hypothetical protein
MDKKRLYISLSLIILFIVAIVWSVVLYFSRVNTIPVQVYVVPNDATVTVGDKNYRHNSTAYLSPGVYIVRASKDDFISQKQELNISSEDTPTIINIALIPLSDEAKQWYEANQDQYLQAEGREGDIASEAGLSFSEKNPITNGLPIQKTIYSIGYKLDPDKNEDAIILTIHTSEGYFEAALDEIRSRGYDPSDFKIEFINYRNPFNG